MLIKLCATYIMANIIVMAIFKSLSRWSTVMYTCWCVYIYMCVCVCVCLCIYVCIYIYIYELSDSLWHHGPQPTRLLCPWDSPARILEWVAMSFSRQIYLVGFRDKLIVRDETIQINQSEFDESEKSINDLKRGKSGKASWMSNICLIG